jgi:hypothetical protein
MNVGIFVTIQREAQHPLSSGRGGWSSAICVLPDSLNSYVFLLMLSNIS